MTLRPAYLTLLLLFYLVVPAKADSFKQRVEPFTQKYCVRCHSREKPRGELDLGQYTSARDVTSDFRRWNSIIEFVRDGKMPPEKSPQPTLDERAAVVETLETILLTEAKKHAGDPGVVLPRRLSNSEYDHSIRDLTGVDIRPTKTFPPDPAGGEGFDNTGEALSMSPSLLKKYLSATQLVANHLVLKPTGAEFAPFPVTSYNERKKLTEQAILDFYSRHDVELSHYLEAAWRSRHNSDASAKRAGLSPKYLAQIRKLLDDSASGRGTFAEMGRLWSMLPAPTANAKPPRELKDLERWIVSMRDKLCHPKEKLIRSNAGNWPIQHLAFRATVAERRDRCEPARLAALPAEDRAFAERFCDTFPNRFFYVDAKRGLAAGFHLVEGFFRDDKPLVEKVLSEDEVAELDRLWQELHFTTNSTETLLRGFVWFERSERHVLHDKRFDFLRPENPQLTEEALLAKFERLYLEKMGVKLKADVLEPEKPSDKFTMIHGFFEQIRRGLGQHRKLMQNAERLALTDVERFAERAYRCALTQKETESLRALYQRLRQQGQGVEDSLRGMLMAILMSPDFCYRYRHAPEQPGVHRLSDEALASRLSYFLWSSLPDDELLTLARQGKLRDEAVLVAQTKRMLKDRKIEAFAREFFGQWLRYRDYLIKDPINSASFPSYTEPLKQAMFEEPTRFFTHHIQHDLPVTQILSSDNTFVNGVLAKHYGGSIEKQYRSHRKARLEQRKSQGESSEGADEVWHKVEGLREAGRGGLFGLPILLTKNSSGERTSPVKRGFWTAHHLLGQHFPPPPADVPELPTSEKTSKQTIRAMLAEHSSNPSCAMCHTHFDGLGLAMEGFDPDWSISLCRSRRSSHRRRRGTSQWRIGQGHRGVDRLRREASASRLREDVVSKVSWLRSGTICGIVGSSPVDEDADRVGAERLPILGSVRGGGDEPAVPPPTWTRRQT